MKTISYKNEIGFGIYTIPDIEERLPDTSPNIGMKKLDVNFLVTHIPGVLIRGIKQ